ncbi:holo-ACP synthase [Nocardioides sp. CPCC 205120]|uniref:holo-ACP synthase n=1 Tax=Nocardioides sp. CPCC 205120 TaxID=3406462 RepID=UPI003B507B0A
MPIVAVGVDVCDVGRFGASLERTPSLRTRLFTPAEVEGRSLESLAARFAAKEALAKALGAPGDLAWHDAEVLREAGAAPYLALRGTVLARATALGVRDSHVSLSHDAGVATAFVVLER